ncbi:flagellar hook-associated protein 3 FlgL [Enterobacter sp. BIGb0383]|uniref:flagellar hook-associated protein FlgL n=1 Tax=unclassified Enterobacter TaxID=2608935 RepID=UPI000F485331|nr:MULTISPECIES: flagellar hook-associated protein FlgL [unclassified Enterobacter]ROP58308.1 flagellar hook-associated protein 3 FlgL [Enterobacter sp. BIGb0383]ROS06804.1 flagellar hook-associated protein 3 FlgL [Enterobacter sp. BIGb0359]
MRLSTHYMFQHNIESMTKAMSSGNDIYSRLSAGQTLLTPSDDPAGASQAITYQKALADMSQYDTARTYAQDALGQEDNVLSSIANILTGSLSEKIVSGGNGTHSDQDRQALATELEGIRGNLRDLGNSRNSSGRYIFSGYKTGAEPFAKDGSYAGGDTPMTQKVGDSVEMQVGHTGQQLFMSGSDNDLLAAIDKAVTALNQPVADDDDRTALQSVLDSVNKVVKNSVDNIGKIQSQVGTNLQQLESLGFSSDAQKITLQSRYQQTVGSDPDTMITLISQSKMSEFALSSSMTVFQTMQKMTLFNFVS